MDSKELRYKKIYQEHYAKVRRLCMGYTGGNETLANDLTQETFIKIWQHLDSFRNESGVGTWIYRIGVNTCLAELKKARKNSADVKVDDIQLVDNDAASSENENRLLELYACINTLSNTNKAIILLELEGVPQLEISEIIGFQHEAVRTRIHRIKKQLTKCVKR